jgi:uncharacterized coiled-coil DUF342 family protein
MLDRIRRSFNEGVKQVRSFASFLAERTKIETSMARQFYESTKLQSKVNRLYTDIGRRVIELEEKGEATGLTDPDILQMIIDEVKRLKKQIEDYKNRVSASEKPLE